VTRKTPKPAMSVEEIAAAEGITVGAAHMHLSRGLKKLRSSGLIFTCRELAGVLDRNRMTENIVRRTARGR
jgi:hypothetical protein